MKFSFNFLKGFVSKKKSPDQPAAILTGHAFELEDAKPLGQEFEGIVVAKVLEINNHDYKI